MFKTLLSASIVFYSFAVSRQLHAQTWSPLRNQPASRLSTCLLLTDGAVICQSGAAWLKLTPDVFGTYRNGTWSQIASFPAGYLPAAYASAVLADGRALVVGGEDNNGAFALTNQGAIYDPKTNVWTTVPGPSNIQYLGDAPAVVLPNGKFLVGGKIDQTLAMLDPATLTWTAISQTGKADPLNSEEGWTLLPDGSVFTLDVKNAPNTERFLPASATWVTAGNTPVDLHTPPFSGPIQIPGGPIYNPPGEVGPTLLRPDGTVFAVGANGFTAIFTPPPAGSSAPGTWVAGPTIPNGLHVEDGPGALLPNGNVLIVGSPGSSGTGTKFYEFNGSALIPVPSPPRTNSQAAFVIQLMVLPTGEILQVDGSSDVEIYTSTGTYNPAWAPTISGAPASVNNGLTYAISGTQFNGLSHGSAFGDESQNATNYPLVRITNNITGRVYYAKTHDHSTMGVATGSAIVSTNFDVPAGIQGGASTVVVVANGIPSAPVAINVVSTVPPVADAALSAASLNFGSVSIGAGNTQSIVLSNTGLATLNISSLVVGGAGFAVSSDGCGSALAAGARCTVAVTFAPTAAGTVNGTLTFTDNSSSGSTQRALLSGTGIVGSSQPFLTSGPYPGSFRNDFSGFVGMRFTVGGAALTVSQLGRWVVSGNSQTHAVKLADAAGNDLPGGAVSVNLNGAVSGQYAYSPLASPITLAANTSYYLVSNELGGGDQWYEYGAVTAGGGGLVNAAAYQSNGTYGLASVSGTAYVTPNLLYLSGGSQPPPTVSITLPQNGATVSGTTALSAVASAAGGLTITSVQFKLNNSNVGPALTAAPYNTTLNTTTFVNGSYSLTAVATDATGNSATSAPVQISISNGSSAGGSPFLTGPPASTRLRNDYGGFVGMQFMVGANPLMVTQLGRWVVAGNSRTHTVKLVDAAGTDLAGGSVALNLGGATPGQYAYGPLATPLTLKANTKYFLVTQELSAGDQWYDYGGVTAASTIGSVTSAAYQFNGTYFLTNTVATSYGPANFLVGSGGSQPPPSVSVTAPSDGATVSGTIPLTAIASAASGLSITGVQFKINGGGVGPLLTGAPYTTLFDTKSLANGGYTLTAFATDSAGGSATSAPVQITVNNTISTGGATPFLSGSPASTRLRNDYSGNVGLQLTVASAPLTVSQLGRWVVAGNQQTHIVKMVDSNGVDLPGGSVSLNLSGAASGQYAYAALASPVTLNANTKYYLMTQEFGAGDTWYDYGPVTAAAAAGVVNSAAYQFNGAYFLTNTAGSSYGPPNFLYGGSGPNPPPSVSVTSPLNGVTVSGTIPLRATASAAGGSSIASVQFRIDGANTALPLTSAPYDATLDTTLLSNGNHSVTALATDSAGASTLSAPVSITVSNGSAGSGTPFLTGTPVTSSPRNDFAGYVGMQFRVGAAPITVTRLGRWVLSGNRQIHNVKLVEANGVDVAGGSVVLDLNGVSVGQYAYAPLASAVTLKANTSYFLVTQEFAGGDTWYNYGAVTSNLAGVVTNAAYQQGGTYFLATSSASSYGPPNFLFQ